MTSSKRPWVAREVLFAREWGSIIELGRVAPRLSRLVGLFRDGRSDPKSLLAFAWGCAHGEYAHYDAAGSTRPDDLRVPLAYALLWDLICWAKRGGAKWFDLGGITFGHRDSSDPLGGISDFKRYFSKQVVVVGQEWMLEPHWGTARIAGFLVTQETGCHAL